LKPKFLVLLGAVVVVAVAASWFVLSPKKEAILAPEQVGLTTPAPHPGAAVSPKVVVVGLDGLDYDFIRNRSNLEFMPNLGMIVRDANTRVFEEEPTKPILSPIIWTSMTTGSSPTRHNVLDFFSYDKGEALPVSTVDRKMPAIWNILSSRGISSLCVGTFISYPAEIIDGIYIADDAFTRGALDRTAIHPDHRVGSISADIKSLMAHAGGWQAALAPFADDELRDNVGRVFSITYAKLELFLDLLTSDDFGFAMVYVEGTDEVGHFLSHLWPTPTDSNQQQLATSVAAAVPAYFALVDGYLGRIVDSCERTGATLMIVSDHGFKWQNNRPQSLPYESGHAASWHTEKGVLLIHHGDLASRPMRSDRVTIYDLFPTVMDIFGLKRASYEMGRSLFLDNRGSDTEDYSQTVKVQYARSEGTDDSELLERLVALGYVRSASNLDDSRYYNNLGVTHDEEGNPEAAIEAFRRAINGAPDNPNPRYNLSMVYFKNRDWDEFVDEFTGAINLGLPNGELAISRVVESLEALNEPGVVEELLSRPLEVDSTVLNPYFLGLARYHYDSDPAASLRWFAEVRTAAPDCQILFLEATCYMRLGQPERAMTLLEGAGCQQELNILTR
jgi:predicted AlkP superfamily phosphohydrolase/phosphomutase